MSPVQTFLLVSVSIWCVMTGPSCAMNHIVGGSIGWTIPPNKTYYEDWAKPRVFGVEDKLVFPFRAPAHNVIEVNKDEFENCTQENILHMYAHGPLIINFTKPGDYYYYSQIGTQCWLGQKLHVTVVPGKGSTGRVFTPAPAPAMPPTSSAPIAMGFGLVTMGLVSLVASGFF